MSVWGGSTGFGSLLAILGLEMVSSCSSSATRRKNCEAHRWPLVNFSSQLKHSSYSRRLSNSSGVSRFRGSGGGFTGEGKRGRLGVGEGTMGEDGEGRGDIGGMWS